MEDADVDRKPLPTGGDVEATSARRDGVERHMSASQAILDNCGERRTAILDVWWNEEIL